MNLPNKLTIFRIILVPVMVIIPFFHISGELWGIPISMWIMNIIFVIASITDKLDGTIARVKNQVTTLGKFLDPIADKILVLAAMMILVEMNKLPAWIVAVEKGGNVVAASIFRQIKNSNTNDSNYLSIY